MLLDEETTTHLVPRADEDLILVDIAVQSQRFFFCFYLVFLGQCPRNPVPLRLQAALLRSMMGYSEHYVGGTKKIEIQV